MASQIHPPKRRLKRYRLLSNTGFHADLTQPGKQNHCLSVDIHRLPASVREWLAWPFRLIASLISGRQVVTLDIRSTWPIDNEAVDSAVYAGVRCCNEALVEGIRTQYLDLEFEHHQLLKTHAKALSRFHRLNDEDTGDDD